LLYKYSTRAKAAVNRKVDGKHQKFLEETVAWGGAYHTEFYPTYDYKPVWEAGHKSGK